MLSAIRINSDGGIEVNREFVIDGHDEVKARIVTHIHSDHTVGLGSSIRSNLRLIATPLTLEWLEVLGHKLPNSIRCAVEYGSQEVIGDVRTTLVKSEHIPGTAQVLMELPNGERVVYTSDFKKPGDATPVLEADALVIDAVYGSPSYIREFDDYIDEVLADLIRELLSKGPVYVYGYYGKIQEVMQLLREYGIDAPFIVTLKHYRLCRVAEKYGLSFGDYILSGTPEAEDVMRDGWFVYFSHMSRRLNGVVGNHVILSGWEFSRPFKRLGSRKWLVAFSDHSDFRGLVRYVVDSGAKLVLINSPRSTGGKEFRDYLVKKLGVKAYLLP